MFSSFFSRLHLSQKLKSVKSSTALIKISFGNNLYLNLLDSLQKLHFKMDLRVLSSLQGCHPARKKRKVGQTVFVHPLRASSFSETLNEKLTSSLTTLKVVMNSRVGCLLSNYSFSVIF